MIKGKILKTGHVTWPRPLEDSRHPKARAWYILPPYKIWRLSLQPFRTYNNIASVETENVSRDLTTPLLRVTCYPYAVTLYGLPVHKIWRLSHFSHSEDMIVGVKI